tara:strand:- start:188 stop:607 length:420 start_codon:yes stop_codon:yes gene_type:complete
MIEAQVSEPQEVQANPTPAVITVSGIIEDLENGIDRDGIAKKYSLNKTEVKTMFLHPALKGKRVKKNKVKELRFTLVDDVTPQSNPNQVTLEDCIDCPEIAETTAESTLHQSTVEDHYSTETESEFETFETLLNDGDSK